MKTSTSWDKYRTAQHQRMYPPEQKGERNRLAQLRYRQRHAARIKQARAVAGLLMKQTWYPQDVEALACTIRELIGMPYAKDLAAELRRQAMTTKAKRASKGRR